MKSLFDSDSAFEFSVPPETGAPVSVLAAESVDAWTVLSVEDDADFQRAIELSLAQHRFEAKPVRLLTAGSSAEAVDILAANPDIAIVLVDIVMESDDAGLKLVETIRNELGNDLIRIVILTGQALSAPPAVTTERLDINEYRDKADVADHLGSIINVNLRSWEALRELRQAMVGLQQIVNLSQSIAATDSVKDLSGVVLDHLAKVIGLNDVADGILITTDGRGEIRPKVICASGHYDSLLADPEESVLTATLCAEVAAMVERSIEQGKHQFSNDLAVLYFMPSRLQHLGTTDAFLAVVKTGETLTQRHIRLLEVFSTNVSSRFRNLLLSSRLHYAAFHDPELGMENVNWLLRRMSTLRDADIASRSLLLVSIDHFVDRALAFGDQHMMTGIMRLYQILSEMMPGADAIVRFDRDSLAALVPSSQVSLQQIADRLQVIDDRSQYRSMNLTSCVVDLSLLDAPDQRDMLHVARSTLLRARERGSRLVAFERDMIAEQVERFSILQLIGTAIQNNEMFMVFQPKVDLRTRRCIGAEALIRWERPGGELVSPADFIPVAEKSGQITAIDRFALSQSIEVARWLRQKGYPLQISVNACHQDLENSGYVNELLKRLREDDLTAELISLEITESEQSSDFARLKDTLGMLRAFGLVINLDDFGTGYASLGQVAHLPVDMIKLDQSFVGDLEHGGASVEVADMVMRIGQRFGYGVIAEGVETEEQCRLLLDLGFTQGQGYLFGAPMSAEEFLVWLRENDAAA